MAEDDKLYQVTFKLTGLPQGGNVSITLDRGEEHEFTLGYPDSDAGNGVTVAGGAAFSEVAFGPKEITLVGPAGGGGGGGATPMVIIGTWIRVAQGHRIGGQVRLPSGTTLKIEAPRGESGTLSSSGEWTAKVA
jgi:hypothetical protein